ncbi:hypothetical protein ACFQO8_01360 [Exiguobacterium aestuarii]|uniref:DUF5666 domain-containing protein n=1 Tax=Exiguobacterium aestuarii TaxID=273527 RepID=A0ABW2PI93_9BACL|nr:MULTISPECIES: hypothetical protein [Exiguobacterium]MCT4784994.1 hypothetical protein [Exiguobacterium aestuarii]
MKRIGWIIGALLGVMAIVGIGFYVSGNQTDTVIVPQAINQASDDASPSEDSNVNASDDSSSSRVEDDYELYGTLVSLTKEDVTISFNGKESTYRLAQTHEIDDDTPQVGDRVKLELNRSDEVKEVDRESGDDDAYITGTLVQLTDQEVTINIDGTDETYPLASRSEIDDDTPRVGDRVKLELNRDQEVIEVDNESEDDQYEQDDSSQDDSSQDDSSQDDSSEDEREND